MSKIYESGFIGHDYQNTSVEWLGDKDTKENFDYNLLENPKLQYYNFRKINYVFNEDGHRCQSVKNIDLENYILFVGCSFTVGEANYIEDTFPYIVSKRLNMDYYNLSVGGSGLDVQLHNLFNWTIKHKLPKYIVWQWSIESRIPSLNKNKLLSHGARSTEKDVVEFLMLGTKINYFNTKKNFAKLLLKNIPTNIICVDIFHSPGAISFDKIDVARDLIHYGPKSNLRLSEKMINIIKE